MRYPTRSLGALILTAATAAGVVACSPAPADTIDRTLTVAVDLLPLDNWDPAQGMLAIDSSYAYQAVLSPLFYWTPSGEAIPALAEGYVVGDDRMSIDITLRDDVTFADGTAMDAAAVEAYFDNLLQSEGYVFRDSVLKVGTDFTAIDEHTLQVTTTSPIFHPDYHYWDVVRMLFVTPVLSPAAIADPERAKAEPLGAGPYVIEESVTDVEVTLVRNPDFPDPDRYPFDTVVLKLLADPIAKLNAIKSGQVNAAELKPEQAAEAETSGLRISYGTPTYYALIVRNPWESTLEPLRDVRVRQAIMLAFDRESIAETLDLGFGRVSSQAFVEGQAEYIEGGDERFGYDPERARELMADAGYADGFDVVIPSVATDTGVQPIIQQSLGDIGIRVTFETFPDGPAFVPALMGGEYPLSLFLMYNINTLRLLDEEFVGLGRVFDQNPELDRLMAAIKQGDPDESAEASRELGEIVLDEGWYIPFSRPAQFWASSGDVEVRTNDIFGIWLHSFELAE